MASELKRKVGVSNNVASEWSYKIGVSNKVACVRDQKGVSKMYKRGRSVRTA